MVRIASLWMFYLLIVPQVQGQSVGIGAKVGSLGAGIEATVPLNDRLNVRMGGGYAGYNHTDTIHDDEIDVRWDGRFHIGALQALLDWHPFDTFFRLSTGLNVNLTQVDGDIRPITSYTVNGRTFSPEKLGSIAVNVKHGTPISPYVGIGFGNTTRGRINLFVDLGTLYTDAPSIEMVGTGMIEPTAEQDDDLEKGFESFRFYPVLQFGVGFNF